MLKATIVYESKKIFIIVIYIISFLIKLMVFWMIGIPIRSSRVKKNTCIILHLNEN